MQNEALDLKAIQRELMTAIRGKRSQGQMNRKIGGGSTRFHRWESAKSRIAWNEFASLCAKCGLPLENALVRACGYDDDPARAAPLVAALVGVSPPAAVAASWGITRFTLHSWLKGKRVPSLDQLLAVFDKTGVLHAFLEELLGSEALPSLAAAARDHRGKLEVFRRSPLSYLVILCLELEGYRRLPRHVDGWISNRLGLSLGEETRLLNGLAQAGFIRLSGEKFRVARGLMNTRPYPALHRELMRFWVEQGQEAMREQPQRPEDRFSFLVYSCAGETGAKVRKILDEAFARIRSEVLEEEAAPTDIAVLTVQSFPIGPNLGEAGKARRKASG